MSDAPRKPVVTATERSPFGDLTPEEVQKMSAAGRDRWFIEGYSDKRIQRELDARAGKKVSPLTHRFHLVPVQTVDGRNIAKGVADKRQEGYRPVTKEDIKALGINIENGAYEIAPDGTVRNGDSMLMVTDSKHAAANYIAQQRRNQALEDAPRARMEEATDRFNRTMGLTERSGTAPIFEVEEPR